MHTENTIVMRAPLDRIFATAADLSLWPKILPHYRYVTYLSRSPEKNLVCMAARRGWMPVRWTAEQEIDHNRHEVRFRHLTWFTKGMSVVWTFTNERGGVLVKIRHDLTSGIPLIGRFFAERIVGEFFIRHIASQTLASMKGYLEADRGG